MTGRVLVVDDNEAIRRLVRKILERDGIAVSEATDGTEALESIGRDDYEAILLDLMMPRTGGFEVIDHLASHRPDVLGRIIVMTAASGLVKHETLRRIRATMMKPFAIGDLLQAVRSCISDHQNPTRRAAAD